MIRAEFCRFYCPLLLVIDVEKSLKYLCNIDKTGIRWQISPIYKNNGKIVNLTYKIPKTDKNMPNFKDKKQI